jgi:outer membrane protein TolC
LSPAGTLNSTPVPPPAAAGAHHEHVGDIPIGGQSSTNTTAFLSGYLSVNQALNEALLKSPRAAAIRAQLRIQAAAYAAATVMMDPQLFRDESNDEQVVRIGPQSTYDPPWKLAFRFAVAKRQVQEQKLEFLNSLWAFRNQVRGAYLELVMAQESYNTLSELATLAERLAGISKRMYTAGSVAGLDVLKAELAAHQAAVDRDQGAGRVALAKQQLNIIMGRHPDATFMVARLPQFKARAEKTGLMPNLNKDVPPVNDFMEIALSNRLELRIVKAQMLVAEAQLRNVWGNIAPDPQVVTGYSATGNAPTGPKFKGEFWTMNYELPFFTYGQGDIVRLKATLRQYQMQILAQRNQIAADVSSGYNHLINARRKIASYQDHILAESERTAQLARRSYEVGQSDITSTLAAQQANVQVKQNYLDAVNTYQQAFTELEQAVGVPLI